MSVRATGLIVLQALFLGRVLGQILVWLAAPSWLPSPEHWFSGLLPYHLLLPAQILLLMFMSLVTYDAVRRDGYWHVRRAATMATLRVLAIIYCFAMAMRYVLTMAFLPELRWHGHAIPILFHFVLAGYLYTLSTASPESQPPASRSATVRSVHQSL